MNEQVRAAVIGGGIVGCSVLYHLARQGWTDSLLIEKRNLTSGSTWHAAGNVTFFGHYPSITYLYVESVKTYLEAQAETDYSISFHATGSLRLAATPAELDAYTKLEPLYEPMDIDYRVIDVDEIRKLHPLLGAKDLLGAAYTPGDGHLDSSGATHALAKAARQRGASIRCGCEVEQIVIKPDGRWLLETSTSSITAEHVVVANSFWARELVQTLGLNLPIYPLEHHEIITEEIPEVECLDFELPTVRDPVAPANIRQEGNGLLCGIYEANPKPWGLDGIPKDFGEELLPNELERVDLHLPHVIERVPVFASAGIKKIINGLICYTPDGCPLLGPVAGHRGLWLATGYSAGIGTGGGSGAYLSQWIANGEPPFDLPAVQPDRFSNNLTKTEIVNTIINIYAKGYILPEL